MKKKDLILQVTSPAPLRFQGVLLCIIALAVLAYTVHKNAASLMALTLTAFGTWVVILLFGLLAGAILFKNFFGKEQILFVKKNAHIEATSQSVIMCDDLIAIERKPQPLPMTPEAKMAMLGLGGERLIFFSKTGAYSFGIGLSVSSATLAIRQIEEFCGRPLLRTGETGQ